MAIASYADLKTAVEAWAGRTDSTFTAQFPNFVAAAERRMQHGHSVPMDPQHSQPLRAAVMEQETSLTTNVGGEVELPDRFLAARAITRPGDGVPLNYEPPRIFTQRVAAALAGDPVCYTVKNNTLAITPPQVATLDLIYYRAPVAINSSNPTSNDVLVDHPEIYLHGCLIEAFDFARNRNDQMSHLQKFNALVAAANSQARSHRFSGGSLQMRTRGWG